METILLGLGLFHSTALADNIEKQKNRNQVIEFVKKNGVASFINNFAAPLFYPKKHQELEKAIHFIKQAGYKTSLKTLIAITKAMRDRENTCSVLANTSCPVLFIIGREDRIVPLETYTQQVFLPPQTSIHILKNVAHMGMLEAPGHTLAILLDFISQCRKYN